MGCVLTDDTRLAVQHRPRREDERREDDGIGHQNDELLRRQPAHVARRHREEPYPRNLKSSAQMFSRPSLSQISDGATLV